MSQITPTSLCSVQWESQVNGENNSGNTDIFHFISDGTVVSWIDFAGFPGGNLNTGGGSAGVTSLNSETGAITVTGSGTNVVTTVGNNINVNGAGVSNINGATGPVTLAAGTNQSITQVGNTFTFSATGGGGTGVTSVNAATGALTVTGTGSTIVTTSGTNINVAGTGGSTPVPWADIQAFGANPHKFAFNQPTAGATTVASTPNVTLNTTGALYQSLKNGQGVVIWAAGAANTGSTPAAPTVTSPPVSGLQTISYQIVGYDNMGGLTAGGPIATIAAPAVFSPLPVPISSITATGGVVTAVFCAPLNGSSGTVAAGMTIHIVGVTGAGGSWNGVWTLASAPSTTTVTFNVTGASGTGTVPSGCHPTSTATGRLSNSQPITGITRNAAGVVTVTTAQNHNYNVSATNFAPTAVIIENCTPVSLNGYWAIASTPTSNTFTVNTGIYNTAVTGSVTAGSSTATVWEFNVVACPQLSGSTIGYYVYSDSPNPGSGLVLIGKVPLGDCNFTDYGQCFIASSGAPAYVPTTAPSSPQNQMLSTTIVSGGGTVNLVLNASAGVSIGSFGATLMYDDGPNLLQACNVASGNTAVASTVLISPPASNSDFSGYIFNSPITIPENCNIIFACEAIINETWTFTAYNQISAQLGSSSTATPAFPTQNFCNVNGVANPVFFLGENLGNTGAIQIDGLCFTLDTNSQAAVIATCFYTRISNCGFKSGLPLALQGAQMAIIYLGSATLGIAENLNWAFANRFYAPGPGVPGQSNLGPVQLPAIWFRGSTNQALPNYNDNTGSFSFLGKHSANGRGICFDHQYSHGNGNQGALTVGDAMWLQQGTTPIVTLSGDIFYGVDIRNILNDTSNAATLANLGANTHDVSVRNSSVGLNYSVVCGNPITNLVASGNTLQLAQQLQRVAYASLTTTSATSDSVSIPNATSGSTYSITPTNASAASDMASGNVYISSKGSGTVTVTHSATSGEQFDLIATVNS